MVRAVFPGTFDPVTYGHLNVVERAARLFDRVIVGVYTDPPKVLTFTADERVEMFRQSLVHLPEVEVRLFSGLMVEFAHEVQAAVVVRGLRIGADFEYERELALMNREIAPDIEVACLLTSLEYQFVSSTRVKEIAELHGDVSRFVPPVVNEKLRQKFGYRRPT
ncbi:MAG: pantetheine-phosphate adenylyltransferase [Gemmatimonadetes bacterium]|nr:pantetheine-phosphate adenylyltransferase [Gemmatimonadota bacterium]